MAASPEEIKTVFRSADSQRKGSLNAQDLRAILAGLTSEEDAHEIVADEPLDADGCITYEEFVDRLCVVDAPKVGALTDFWRLAGPSGSCALADLEALLPSGHAPPAVDDSGLVTRDVFLAWFFGHEGDAPALVRMALLARTSALLLSAKSTPAGALDAMYPQEAMQAHRAWWDETQAEEDFESLRAWWDETLAEFPVLHTNPAPAQAAGHFLNVVRAGLDANAIAFPQMPRPAKSFPPAGFPSSRPSSAAKAAQQDIRPFLLPHVCEGGGARREAAPEEAGCAEPDCWLDGLARHAEELCAGRYEGEPMDTEVTAAVWPEIAAGVIAADTCTEAQETTIAKRAELGEFSAERLARKHKKLSAYFDQCYGRGSPFWKPEGVVVNPKVFVEIFPELEKEAALQAVQARHDADKAASVAAHDDLAEEGAVFVVWPEVGSRKWKPDRTFQRHAQWFARWRATPRVAEAPGDAIRAGEQMGDLAAGRLKRSDSNASISSWLSVSDISWIEVESRAEQCSWQEVIEDSRPQLLEARSALDCLSKAAISELKAMAKPPVGVKLVMEVVCIIFGVKPTVRTIPGLSDKVRDYWPASKELLGDSNFLNRLTSILYLPKSTLDALAPYIELDEFRVEHVMKASYAAAGLCEWARASFKYHTLMNASGIARDKALAGRPKEELIVEALASLDVLSLADIQELKSLCKPPLGVCEVCVCVAHLVEPELSNKNRDWKGCQKMMNNPTAFLILLKQFPRSISEGLVSPTHVAKARRIVQAMGTSFSFEEMKRKSTAVAGLASWALNVIAYYDQINPPAPEMGGQPSPAKADPKLVDPQVVVVLSLVGRIHELELSDIGSVEAAPPILGNICRSVFHLLAGLADGEARADGDPSWDDCKTMVESPGLFLKRLSAVPEDISKGRIAQSCVENVRRCRASLGEAEASSLARAEVVHERKWQCKADVDRLAAVVSKCRSSLDVLCKADITELKALSHPPAVVALVMEAVCVCLGVEPQTFAGPDGEPEIKDYWGPSRKLLTDARFLHKLVDFSAVDMPDEVIEKLQPLLANPCFDQQAVAKSSRAAAGLCVWVRSAVALRSASSEAREKQATLQEAEARLEAVEALGPGGPVAVSLSAYLAGVLGYFDASASGVAAA